MENEPQKKSFHPQDLPATNHSALVWLDEFPKRQKERKIYHLRCKELEQATKQLRYFEEVDKPEFTLWLETEFADLMTSCQNAVAELSEISRLIELVKYYAQLQKIPLSISHEIVGAAKDLAIGAGQVFDDFFADFFTKATGEPFATRFCDGENTHSRSRHDSADREEPHNRTHDKVPATKHDQLPHDYLKKIYRQLVRLLHPDSASAASAETQDLWHEVQNAYGWHDLQRLESILANLSEKKQRPVDLDTIPISHIMELRKDVERRLDSVKNRLKTAQKDKAWTFHSVRKNKRQLQTLVKKIKYELQSDLRGINAEISRYERQIFLWDTPAPRKRRHK